MFIEVRFLGLVITTEEIDTEKRKQLARSVYTGVWRKTGASVAAVGQARQEEPTSVLVSKIERCALFGRAADVAHRDGGSAGSGRR